MGPSKRAPDGTNQGALHRETLHTTPALDARLSDIPPFNLENWLPQFSFREAAYFKMPIIAMRFEDL